MNPYLPLHVLLNSASVPNDPITNEMYDLVSDPVRMIIVMYLIDRGKPPMLAYDRDLKDIYNTAFSNLTPTNQVQQHKRYNRYMGRILCSTLAAFSLVPYNNVRINNDTDGLIQTSKNYIDVIPGTPATFHIDHTPATFYPSPIMSFDVRTLSFIPPYILNGKYNRTK